MEKFYRLSYSIQDRAPLYPGTPPVIVERVKDKRKGDSCNKYYISLSSHAGTHMDAPFHFFNSGRKADSYKPEELIFDRPISIDCPCAPDKAIDIRTLEKIIPKVNFDFLIIRTSFASRYRKRDKNIYSTKNPYITKGAAKWLRDRFSSMRGLGVDFISISSRLHRDDGRRSHEILLGESRGRPGLVIVEDMKLPAKIKKLDRVMVLPLFIEGIDSAPCTVIGISDD